MSHKLSFTDTGVPTVDGRVLDRQGSSQSGIPVYGTQDYIIGAGVGRSGGFEVHVQPRSANAQPLIIDDDGASQMFNYMLAHRLDRYSIDGATTLPRSLLNSTSLPSTHLNGELQPDAPQTGRPAPAPAAAPAAIPPAATATPPAATATPPAATTTPPQSTRPITLPAVISNPNIVAKATVVAGQENRLWQIAHDGGFEAIAATASAVSGEDMIGIVDKYVSDHSFTGTERVDARLSFIQGANGAPDPRVAAFLAAHPDKAAALQQYAQQYVTIAQGTAALNQSLVDIGATPVAAAAISGQVIADVDKRYEDGGPGNTNFNAEQVARAALATSTSRAAAPAPAVSTQTPPPAATTTPPGQAATTLAATTAAAATAALTPATAVIGAAAGVIRTQVAAAVAPATRPQTPEEYWRDKSIPGVNADYIGKMQGGLLQLGLLHGTFARGELDAPTRAALKTIQDATPGIGTNGDLTYGTMNTLNARIGTDRQRYEDWRVLNAHVGDARVQEELARLGGGDKVRGTYALQGHNLTAEQLAEVHALAATFSTSPPAQTVPPGTTPPTQASLPIRQPSGQQDVGPGGRA